MSSRKKVKKKVESDDKEKIVSNDNNSTEEIGYDEYMKEDIGLLEENEEEVKTTTHSKKPSNKKIKEEIPYNKSPQPTNYNTLLSFILRSSRPLGTTELTNIFSKYMNKKTMLELLDTMVSNDEIICKTFKKSVIYFKKIRPADENTINKYNNLLNTIKESKNIKYKKEHQLNDILKSMDDNTIKNKIEDINKEIMAIKEEMENTTYNTPMEQQQIDNIEKEYNIIYKTYKERKNTLDNIIHTLADALNIKEKTLKQDAEIDEEYKDIKL